MSLYSKIVNGEEKISLVGLGYVGMPIAVAFSKKVKVIGYDLNEKKIELYKSGIAVCLYISHGAGCLLRKRSHEDSPPA